MIVSMLSADVAAASHSAQAAPQTATSHVCELCIGRLPLLGEETTVKECRNMLRGRR